MSTGFHGKLALRRLQKLRQHRRQHRPKNENQPRENPGSYQSRQEGRWKDLKEDAKTLANEEDALEEDCFSQKHLRCLGSRLVALAAGEGRKEGREEGRKGGNSLRKASLGGSETACWTERKPCK